MGGRCGAWGGTEEQEEDDTKSWVGCVCPYQSPVAFLLRKQWRWSSNGGWVFPMWPFHFRPPLLSSLFPPPRDVWVMSLRHGWLIRPDITPHHNLLTGGGPLDNFWPMHSLRHKHTHAKPTHGHAIMCTAVRAGTLMHTHACTQASPQFSESLSGHVPGVQPVCASLCTVISFIYLKS